MRTAARKIADGELVAFPTETVYGLGARADDDAAVARIYAAKGRPADHPLIVHVPDVEAARRFAGAWPPLAQRLADAFWPGPLTLIVQRAPGMASAAAGGHDTIGLRCAGASAGAALLEATQRLGVAGIAAPSANRFGRVSPTRAEHVLSEFESDAGLTVLDGGACRIGIESAIVDVSRGERGAAASRRAGARPHRGRGGRGRCSMPMPPRRAPRARSKRTTRRARRFAS